MSTEVKSGGSLAWAIMACSLFSHLGTACLLYLYVINVIYLVPNKAVKKMPRSLIKRTHSRYSEPNRYEQQSLGIRGFLI